MPQGSSINCFVHINSYKCIARKLACLLFLGLTSFLLVACSTATPQPTPTVSPPPTPISTYTAAPPTAPPTLTPSPVPTRTRTPAPSRTPTATPAPATATLFLPTPIATNPVTQTPGRIAVVIQLWGDIVLGDNIEILDDNFNFLYRFPSNYMWLSSFSPDGCHLRAINYTDGSFIIRELDLHGVETRKITALSKLVEDEGNIYQFTLSPSGRWLAYKVADQIQMSIDGAKIQDVRLLKVDEQTPQEVLRLTEHGGARPARVSWSPDGQYLLYTDYDEAGVVQIYVYNPDEKQKYQITHFGQDMKDHEIQILSWSPDSQAIAFSIVGVHETKGDITMTNNGAIGIISVPGFRLKWLDFEGYKSPVLYNDLIAGSTTFWWSKDSQTLLVPFEISKGKTTIAYLAWYGLRLDKVTDLLDGSNFKGLIDFWSAFPLSDLNKIGIWGGNADYIYSRDTKEIDKLALKYFLHENSVFLVAPNGPIDPAQCSDQ